MAAIPTSDGTPTGATLQAQYMGRTMKCYPVHESEIDALATLNTEATAFFSAASASFAFAVGIWTNAAFADHLTPVAELASSLAAPALTVLAAFLLGLGIYAAVKRHGLWKRIRREAVNLHATV